MSNCPAPGWTVEGMGMRLSWGWDWAVASAGAKTASNRTFRVRIVILLELILPVAPARWTQAVAGGPGHVSATQSADSISCGRLLPRSFGGADSADIQRHDPKSEKLETRLFLRMLTVPRSSCQPVLPRVLCGNRGRAESS